MRKRNDKEYSATERIGGERANDWDKETSYTHERHQKMVFPWKLARNAWFFGDKSPSLAVTVNQWSLVHEDFPHSHKKRIG